MGAELTLADFRRVLRPGGVCAVNVPVLARQARPGVLRLQARPVAGRGDGRPQDVLRPARPVAAAGAGPASCRTPSSASGTSSASTPSPSADRRHEETAHDASPRTSSRETVELVQNLDTDADRERWPPASPRSASAGAGCSSSASAARPAHASHAVNDFRKICDVESYSPIDNVSELTARANDEGWDTTFAAWLHGSRLDAERRACWSSRSAAATPRRRCLDQHRGARSTSPRSAAPPIFGIVGRDGGYTAQLADACVIVPPTFADHITPHTEGCAAVIWHLLVSHPALAARRPSGSPSYDASGAERLRRICVVGGAGFIGSHFVDALLARPGHRAGHRLRQLLLRPRLAPRARSRTTRG